MGNNDNLNEKLIDIELAKSDNNSKVRKVLPAIVLMASLYYSFFLGLGLALGYLGARMYAKFFIENGKVDCIYIDFTKNWKIHMHHWILGSIFLLAIWFIDYFYLPSFFVGAVVGIIGIKYWSKTKQNKKN
jgi:hypothetical protein